MATFRMSQCQDGDEVLKCCEWRCEGTKDALENLNTRKGASRRILKGILSKSTEYLLIDGKGNNMTTTTTT